jgi:Stage II sporulation protein E (SpoIIE)
MVSRWFDRDDRQAFTVGAVALVVLTAAYPAFADTADRPLGVFVLPGLVAAVLGGWRPTVIVGSLSLMMAVVFGIAGPLAPAALFARWTIVAAGVLIGAVGAAVRERQAGRIAELDETRVLLEAFERGLAPSPNPPAGYVAVARYRPAESRLHLGGDFLEAVALADGRLAVLIGDVCGHGPREAAFGAALRAGWKSIALGDKHDPADWLEALNRSFFCDGRIDTYVTICTGYLDRAAGATRLVNAGHPAPVMLGRTPQPLDVLPLPPLGLGFTTAWTATELPWQGDPVLFYTDGLIENPRADGPARRWGEDGLLDWLRRQPSDVPAGRFLDSLLRAATDGRDLRDDVALLFVTSN